jgi:purine-binding chemotaxis protein CheW
VIVVENTGRLVGLIVDAASEVMKLPVSQVEPPPNVFTENEITYVTGVGKLNNRLIILVDLQKVLTRGELRKIGDALEAQEVAN